MEKPGIKPVTPGLQDIGLSPTPRQLHIKKKHFFFFAFPWVVTSTGPGGFMICVFIITPEDSTESGFT